MAVDYNTNRVGNYNVLVGMDDRFCTTVATYYGTAQASVDVLGHAVQSPAALLSTASTR